MLTGRICGKTNETLSEPICVCLCVCACLVYVFFCLYFMIADRLMTTWTFCLESLLRTVCGEFRVCSNIRQMHVVFRVFSNSISVCQGLLYCLVNITGHDAKKRPENVDESA